MVRVLNRVAQWAKYRGPGSQRQLLALAINNMTQGVVMFDLAGRLVVRNDRYLKMYDLPPDSGEAGRGSVRHRPASSQGRQPPARSGAILRRGHGENGVRKDRKVHHRNRGRPRHRGCQSCDRRDLLLGRHARRHYRAPCGGTAKRPGRRSGGTPRGARRRHHLVPRKRRGGFENGRRQRRRDESNRGRPRCHVERDIQSRPPARSPHRTRRPGASRSRRRQPTSSPHRSPKSTASCFALRTS